MKTIGVDPVRNSVKFFFKPRPVRNFLYCRSARKDDSSSHSMLLVPDCTFRDPSQFAHVQVGEQSISVRQTIGEQIRRMENENVEQGTVQEKSIPGNL